jgi:hypothetical protein
LNSAEYSQTGRVVKPHFRFWLDTNFPDGFLIGPRQHGKQKSDHMTIRRGGRVVECAGLENRYGRKSIGGSNPPLSASAWKTSIFPDSGSGSFVLPIKKEIRNAEGLAAGDRARVHLELAIEPF